MDKRLGKVTWGRGNPRVRTSAAYWRQPVAWDREAAQAGVRARVFCASLADVFDEEVDRRWREDLWRLIEATPHLDWLLLTKRPLMMLDETARLGLPRNVWLGVSVEDQATAMDRVPFLIKTTATVRFLSVEPLLSPVDLSRWTDQTSRWHVNWVIVGVVS